jgi:hypothetical protein
MDTRSVDPATVLTVIKWVLENKPIKKWKARKEIKMNQEVIGLLIRHALTFGGGAGLFTDNELIQVSGAVATLAGVLWSAYRKWKRAKEQG